MFFYVRRERVIILIACADTTWLTLNILWAIGDLFHAKVAFVAAKILFWIGVTICMTAFGLSENGKKLSFLVLSRLRIIKYFGG